MLRHLSPRTGTRTGAAPHRPGLSILEVILALAILVLSVAAIGQLVSMGSDRGNDARVLIRGTRLAQSKMAEVEAGVIPISGGASGQFSYDDSAWSYQVTSTPVATPASPVNVQGQPLLYTVTVVVSRTGSGPNAQFALTRMLMDPNWTGTSAQAEVGTANTGTTGTPGTTGTGGTSP